jgi:hypothetical protein
MLFSLSYKNASNEQFTVNLSGSNMSSAILYCDSNNFTPYQISYLLNQNLLLNNPSTTECYSVGLKDTSTDNSTSYLIYDTFENVNNWIQSQSNKQVSVISLQDRAFIQA